VTSAKPNQWGTRVDIPPVVVGICDTQVAFALIGVIVTMADK